MTFEEIYEEYESRFYDIPFENSQVQNRANLLEGREFSPGRRYRATGLRLRSRLNDLANLYFQKRRDAVKVAKLNDTIKNSEDQYEVEFAKIDLEEMQYQERDIKKLLNDALVEIETLLDSARAIGHVGRKEFEQQEIQHFTGKNGQQVGMMLERIVKDVEFIDNPTVLQLKDVEKLLSIGGGYEQR
jgi:hypothetical protein